MSEENDYESIGINLHRDLVAITMRIQNIEDKLVDLQNQIDEIKKTRKNMEGRLMVRRKVEIPHEDGTDASYEADSKIAEIEKRLDDLESAVKEVALIIKKILHGREYT